MSANTGDSARLIQILHFDEEKVVEAVWKNSEKNILDEIVIYDISGKPFSKLELIKSYLVETDSVPYDDEA